MGSDIGYSGGAGTTAEMKLQIAGRVEIDTSVPFESVRQAANRFGGIGFWKPCQHKLFDDTPERHDVKETNIETLQEQAAELEKGLFVKERETFELLKELEATKSTIKELNSIVLQKEASEATDIIETRPNIERSPLEERNFSAGSPGLILMVLNQAKSNLSKTTRDLTEIRSSVDLLHETLEKERTSLEKTRERLKINSSKVSLIEKELNDTETKLKFAKDPGISGRFSGKPPDVKKELERLRAEAENSKKMGETARSTIIRAMSEIERMKSKIEAADIRSVSARKMKKAARAAEAIVLAEIRAVKNSESSPRIGEMVTISFEEYSLVTQKAKVAEEKAEKRVEEAMIKVDEARFSEKGIQKMADQAAEEIRTRKKALEEAVERVEVADNAKLEAEETLRQWRSDSAYKRRSSSVHNRSRFKNTCLSQHKRESHLLDVNGLNLISDDETPSKMPILKPTLSIGQILSRKLVVADESEMTGKEGVRQRVSLGQMLRQTDDNVCSNKDGKEVGRKRRKKFGLGKLSVLLNKDSKRKKKEKNNNKNKKPSPKLRF